MAEAAGVFYAAETLVEGALAAAKGIYDPTLPLKATLLPVRDLALNRHSHTASLVKGRAYVFGGITSDKDGKEASCIIPRLRSQANTLEALADNDVHVIVLPISGIDTADYKRIPAGPGSPPPRYGHSAAVLDGQVYIYGGSEQIDGAPSSSIWVFDTRASRWTELPADKTTTPPPARLHHASVITEHPRKPVKRTDQDRLPQREPDLTSNDIPEPEAVTTYGTLIILGGVPSTDADDNFSDVWAFDIASRTWAPLPSVSLTTRASPAPSLAIVGPRLYTYSSGTVQFMDLATETFSDEGGTGELGISSLGPWNPIPHSADNKGPDERTGAALEVVTTGQGRNYLALLGGQVPDGKDEAKGDIWTMQLRPEGMTAASFKDAARMAFKKDTGEREWAEVRYFNGEGVMVQEGQEGRGLGSRISFAGSKDWDEDGGTVFTHGGRLVDGTVLGDGLLITFEI